MRLFGLLSVLFLTAAHSAPVYSLNDFLTDYDRANANGRKTLEAMISEADRTLYWTNKLLDEHWFCADGDDEKAAQIIEALRGERKTKPVSGGYPLELALLWLKRDRNPCYIR